MLRFLSSMKMAVLLIVGIALFSILATIFPEVDAFSSWTFRSLVMAFFVNLSLCTVKIFPAFWRQLHRTPADISVVVEEQAGLSADLDQLRQWVREQKYKLQEEETAEQVRLLATKGKLGLAAPHLLHIALLVILVGCVCYTFNVSGAFMAYTGQTPVLPAALQSIYGEDSYVEIRSFETAYDEYGAIDNWITTFNLYLDGQLVGEQVETKVNAPYQYRELVIYQNSYGLQHLVEISGSPNEEENGTYAWPDNRFFPIGDSHVAVMNMGGGKNYLHASDKDNFTVEQYIASGDKVEIAEGIYLEYLEESAYTVLELKTVRGLYVVFFGFFLATIASMLFWSGRYREIQIIYEKASGKAWVRFYSKSPVLVEKMKEDWQEKWSLKS